jgi:hypothetical protein
MKRKNLARPSRTDLGLGYDAPDYQASSLLDLVYVSCRKSIFDFRIWNIWDDLPGHKFAGLVNF